MTNSKKSLILVIFLSISMVLLFLALILLFISSYILLIVNLTPTSIYCIYLIVNFIKEKKNNLNNNNNNKNIDKKFKLPIILLGLAIAPLIISTILSIIFSFELYLLVFSLAIPLIFMTIFFFLPLAIYDKYFIKKSKIRTLLPSLSIIIPAYNEEANLRRTLNSIIEADYKNKQIIVVDDGSTDRTYAIASSYKNQFSANEFSVIKKQNGGKSSAINLGVRFAIGEIIVVIDADSIIGRNTLKEIANEFKNPNIIAVAGKAKVLNRSNILTNCTALELIISANLLRSVFSLFGVVMIIPGALGGFRKNSILKRGLYDKDTFTEDFDITLKLLKSGGNVVGASTISYTEAPTTLKDFYKQRLRWNRGNFQTLIKHKDLVSINKHKMLNRFGYPITLSTFLVPPFFDIFLTVFVLIVILEGSGPSIIIPLTLFFSLQILQSAIAIAMEENAEWKLLLYSPVVISIYKQILNYIIIKSIFDIVFHKKKFTKTRN